MVGGVLDQEVRWSRSELSSFIGFVYSTLFPATTGFHRFFLEVGGLVYGAPPPPRAPLFARRSKGRSPRAGSPPLPLGSLETAGMKANGKFLNEPSEKDF